jgi:hypothetical protein
MWNYTMVHLEEIFYIYNKDYFEIDSFNDEEDPSLVLG